MGIFRSRRARADRHRRGLGADRPDAVDTPDLPNGRLEPLARDGKSTPLVADPNPAPRYPAANGNDRLSTDWPRGAVPSAVGLRAAYAQVTLELSTAASARSGLEHDASVAGSDFGSQEDASPAVELGWLARSRMRAAATAAFKPGLLKRGREEASSRSDRQLAATSVTDRDVPAEVNGTNPLVPVLSNGQFSVSVAGTDGELARPGERYQSVIPQPLDWILLSDPEAPGPALTGAPRRGRHARSGPLSTFLSEGTPEGDGHDLLELTTAMEGWHHRQTGNGVEPTDRSRGQDGPRHAASQREPRVGYEGEVRAEGMPVDGHVDERDELGGAVAWPEEDLVSRETAPALEPIVAATRARSDDRADRRIPMPRPAKPRTLVVANQKGGVGKTTTAVNLAAALATHGCRVLVLDLDPQGNASTALGVDHFAGVPSVYEVIIEGKPLAEILCQAEGIDGLFCAPATLDLAGAEIELVALVARESRLARALSSFDQYFDYILIDCPPSLGLLTVNALVAAEEVLIPIQCEYYALEGLGQLMRNVDLVKAHLNPKLHVSTIVLTMFDGRTRLAAQVADEVRQHFEGLVLDSTIPRSVRISEAPSYGQTVITYDPVSTGAQSYINAARELAARGAGPTDSAGQSASWGAP